MALADLECSLAMNLRQPNIVQWDSYLDECIFMLQHSEDAPSSDRMLYKWALMQHEADEIVQRALSKASNLTPETSQAAVEALVADALVWEGEHASCKDKDSGMFHLFSIF